MYRSKCVGTREMDVTIAVCVLHGDFTRRASGSARAFACYLVYGEPIMLVGVLYSSASPEIHRSLCFVIQFSVSWCFTTTKPQGVSRLV